MSISYNEKIIESFADKLYQMADRIVLTYVVIGLLVGGILGAIASELSSNSIMTLLLAVIGAGIGYAIASPKAFLLRLQAQISLCQVQIERNTRPQM
jgi:uncharacterized membrane protein YeaQ/YmgE (transglycosylase-associated protein family)